MTILSREGVDGDWTAMLTDEHLHNLIDTAYAYHDLRDAVLALIPEDNFDFDDAPEDVWRFVRDLRAALDGEA